MKQRSPTTVGVLIALAVIGLLIGIWLFQRLGGIIALVLTALVLATGIAPLMRGISRSRFHSAYRDPPERSHI